jgi:hypothetical protein
MLMTDEELDAYSRGVAASYSAVFAAFTRAFDSGEDIHWLRESISAQWADLRATGTVRGVL